MALIRQGRRVGWLVAMTGDGHNDARLWHRRELSGGGDDNTGTWRQEAGKHGRPGIQPDKA